ncbi:glycolipid 2-alpha-mannosyltransferase [Zalerion maritima]|uniref:Glycolipid 2-alpha-mannosyltransferase n=1 Tax=Zalerion maritima TaxID=339359 RepID=A0AAD5WN51_9PEZI|nr:glycolipid 2-alpha-mannosyltransferase [Zalerion maritima]
MVLNRPARALALAALIMWFFFLYTIFTPSTPAPKKVPAKKTANDHLSFPPGEDPMLADFDEPAGILHRTGPEYAPDAQNSARINATLLSLVRNSELNDMLRSMRDLESTWNHKFNYPWMFFNDEEFSQEFKQKTQAETKAKCSYHVVPPEHWDIPSWINEDLYQESAKILAENKVQYADQKSYHQMCRWNSGMFYKHPALQDFQYYWRVEPKVHFFCDIDYDVFRFMRDHNKTYGFTINLFDDPKTVPTLWPETTRFMAAHPEYIHPNNAQGWLTDAEHWPEHTQDANGYSTCHFWSNFEIADMTFWRSKVYEDYFNHLDRAGGFFYERWGDAPVHSVALGLFEDKNRIHWFRDIGYQHIPFFNCPKRGKCKGCVAGRFTDGESWLNDNDCRPLWFKYAHMD